MKIKYSFMMFLSNITIYILITLEIFVLLTAANLSVSSINSRTMLYNPVKPYLEKKGFFACSTLEETTDLSEYLSSEAELINLKSYNDSYIGYTIINDEIFDELNLPLKSGKKFESDKKGNYPQLIVTSNNDGYKKGDIITDVHGQEYMISAVLTDLSYFLNFNKWSADMTYRDFYYTLDIKYDDTPRFFTSESQVEELIQNRKLEASSGMIVIYPDSSSDDVIEKDKAALSEFALISDNKDILRRSNVELKDDTRKILPPVLLFGIIVMLGIVSCAIITAQKNISKLVFFHLCGASRKECIWINCGNMMISVIIAYVLSASTLFFISLSNLPYKYGFVFNINNLYVFLIIGMLILGISVAVTTRIISKEKIYTLICNREKE